MAPQWESPLSLFRSKQPTHVSQQQLFTYECFLFLPTPHLIKKKGVMVTGIRVSHLTLFAHLKEYFNIFTKMFKLGLFGCDFDRQTSS